MNDKQFELFSIVVAIALFVWWLIARHENQASNTPGENAGAFPETNWPMDSVSPETFMPPTLGDLSLNVQNPGFNLLSNQYIPLFGFVGMAQGGTYGG